MSDLGLTNPQETLLGHPVRSATSGPWVAGRSGGAGAAPPPPPPSLPEWSAKAPPWPSGLAGQEYGDCWRTEEVGGSPPLH